MSKNIPEDDLCTSICLLGAPRRFADLQLTTEPERAHRAQYSRILQSVWRKDSHGPCHEKEKTYS